MKLGPKCSKMPPHLRRALSRIAVALLLCVFISGVGIGRAQTNTFRLGVSCPLSGVLAEYGAAVRNGIELARKEQPELFSRTEIVYEDSQWDPKTAISAFRALTTQRKVDLVFNWGNPTSEAVAPIAEKGGIPTVVMSSDPSISKGKRFVTRTINSAADLGEVLGRELQRRGLKSVGIVLAENSYVRGVVAGLERTLLPASSVTVVDRVPLDAQDFRSVISKMKARNFDVLGVMLISGQISSFYKQMKVQNLLRPTFGPDFLDSTAELNAAGSAVEGAFHPNFDVIDDFRARYVAAYGNDTQIPFAANSYDVANIVAELFGSESRRPKSPEDVVTAIRSVRDYHGANGTMSVTEGEGKDYFFKYPLILKEARAGRSVTMR